MPFYDGPERDLFLLPEAKIFFSENGILTLPFEEANSLVPVDIFDTFNVEGGVLSIPKSVRINTPVPYEPLEHEDHKIDGISIDKIIEEYVSTNFSKDKFLFSGREDVFFAIKMPVFSYDILYHVHSGHMTTPMILFDIGHLHAIFFENDLAINTLSIDNTCADEKLFGKDNSFWVDYFNKNFLRGISYNENHVGIINKYYRPVIEGLKITVRT